ncbi:hypothetical protein IMCC9480_2614 [Oxalobacteraceae bacterium IMCC9480]|nr:hypothetical protein IMCC9480_2614 [Oxalobacteraceae bacterium IMCC9480]
MDWNFSVVQYFNLGSIKIKTEDMVTNFSEASAGNKSYITGTDYSDFHVFNIPKYLITKNFVVVS